MNSYDTSGMNVGYPLTHLRPDLPREPIEALTAWAKPNIAPIAVNASGKRCEAVRRNTVASWWSILFGATRCGASRLDSASLSDEF